MTESGNKDQGDTSVNIENGGFAIQNSEVHASTHFELRADATPHELLQKAQKLLDVRARTQALELLKTAVAELGTLESRVYLALALLSGRSLRDLDEDERCQLDGLRRFIKWHNDPLWTNTAELICELIDRHDNGTPDADRLACQIEKLEPEQKGLVSDHLKHVLAGEEKELIWEQIRLRAKEGQYSNNREGRIWAYFCPKPASARAHIPPPIATTNSDVLHAKSWLAMLLLSLTYIGWFLVTNTGIPTVATYVIAVGLTFLSVTCGMEWHYRSKRIAYKDRLYTYDPFRRRPEAGFAGKVTDYVRERFQKSIPANVDKKTWMDDTAGLRAALCNEIVDLYGDQKKYVGKVRWLICDLTWDIQNRYTNGYLYTYRERYRTPYPTKLWCIGAAALGATFWIGTIVDLFSAFPIRTAAAALITLGVTLTSVKRWTHIVQERRRFEDDENEYQEDIAQREAWRNRWLKKIDDHCPTEEEMEHWLNCDTTLILDKALRNYRISWTDVIREATLISPAANSYRARRNLGPWRYSKYNVQTFLITRDGVREISTELDFKNLDPGEQDRHNFRFDAVSSIHVRQSAESEYELNLTLTNGDPRNIPVVISSGEDLQKSEKTENVAQMNLDASGFVHTLRLLEGIAAEGKEWIQREPVQH
ncbi:hypothetical protein FB384_003924 [Prauserella sediminis]|uniref:Uncharacterized protein n=1 Tax=Prauserella sediminis TaxID=577680 RepID=A0A839XWY0_9PSEU|nr:hypothetical protein [Prauserella sediminis]MBB3664973.1 hypothetical protein [Prauserella sediminis]